MRVQLLQPCSGLIGEYRPGNVVDLPKAKAVRLIETGRAAPIHMDTTERAVVRDELETRNG